MKNTLVAEDPLNELLGHSTRSGAMEILTASQFSLKDPSSEQLSFSVLSRLRVLSRSGDWTCVLLPGWGQAWVHKDSILDTQTRALGTSVIKSIPSLSFLNMTYESSRAVLDLLKLIGQSTRKINVEAKQQAVLKPQHFDDWCSKLLVTCPMLEDLELHDCSIASLQVFLDGYTSGTCRLQRLVLESSLQQFDDTVLELFRALGNKHHAAARYLREFECRVWPTTSRARACEIFSAAVEMLGNNNRLQRFTVDLQSDRADEPALEKAALPLCDLDLVPVSGFSSPAQRCKMLALLSVVPGHNGAVGKLDAALLTVVFQFIAMTRRVRVVLNCSVLPERRT